MPHQPQPPIPYEQTSDYHWTEVAFELLESGALAAVVMTSDNVSSAVVEGTCPRCAHHFTDRRPLTAVTSGIGGSRTGVQGAGGTGLVEPARTYGHGDLVVLDVTCSCGTTHPAEASEATEPNAVGGCGVSFRIELTADPAPDPAGGQS
ncbi:hypothetical protein ACFYY1_28425 [Streptomyces sp. NPDC001890]|uniref:hypothetical protein n=1 Tax=Streptomyces sp. NPDC001890 TaxID=3364620 RepID=UPI00367A6BDF